MVISAMVNLLADWGIVPSWSSALTLVAKLRMTSAIMYTKPGAKATPCKIEGKCNQLLPKTGVLAPIQASELILESTTPPVLNIRRGCQRGFYPHCANPVPE
eukprot:4834580-Amphidinium_carterae.1